MSLIIDKLDSGLFKFHSRSELLRLIYSLKYRSPFHSENDPVVKLFESKSSEVVPLLIGALKFHEPNIRQGAALVLGYRKEKAAVAPLIQCLQDPDEYVRATAANSLQKLKDPEAVKPLSLCLNDDIEAVRRSALLALGSIGTEEARQALKKTIEDSSDTLLKELAQKLLNK